jgi:hypothetical protein
VGLVVNDAQATGEVTMTNAEILRKILDVPVLDGLGENLSQLPADWQLMLHSPVES